ncbi:hypothetical protein Lalb_Chr12g0207641 [Lupinus albus]|uniref:Uncharacterized protein n=1 Tax=Lupinus albus TaxID=3870 RepID=A0A6A4PNW7_LUPAL|nr:hypothetical protein Lalb_Chr12g0207641 [Lupinus albus]
MNTSSSKSPCKKALFTSNCSINQFCEDATTNRVRTVVSLTTGAKLSRFGSLGEYVEMIEDSSISNNLQGNHT